ncbi:MAG TPA: hypothetical protein VLA88_00875 [Candidatus Saccharimonadales bacterium]|nr:hypothetical protein [Candidatus Saccharimonadales bacterium]
MQAGKSNTFAQFAQMGIPYIGLNAPSNCLRRTSPALRQAYEQAGLLDTLDERGRQELTFYLRLGQYPELFPTIMDVEVPMVTGVAQAMLAAERGPHVAISWAYMHLLVGELPINHVFFLRPNKRVWHRRLRGRALAMGLPRHGHISDGVIQQIAHSTRMDPDFIEQMLLATGVPMTMIDSSGQDQGGLVVRRTIESLVR